MEDNVIRNHLLKHIPGHPRDIVTFSMNHLSCSRTTIMRHLQALIKANKVIKSGSKKGTYYMLVDSLNKCIKIDFAGKKDEFAVWEKHFSRQVSKFSLSVQDVCSYAFTELLNNAFDHSVGTTATITSDYRNGILHFTIADDGIGIFKKIGQALVISDLRESILQLEKGKFTTDRKNHTGEGVFFSSRVVDKIQIAANDLIYLRDNIENDWFVESVKTAPGTKIDFYLSTASNNNLIEIFEKYQDDNYDFVKTDITVELSKHGGDSYISRSQAKRILRNLEPFTEITLDFNKVRMVGQGFVDEIFRVYQVRYPEKIINYTNANDDVMFMIKRGLKRDRS